PGAAQGPHDRPRRARLLRPDHRGRLLEGVVPQAEPLRFVRRAAGAAGPGGAEVTRAIVVSIDGLAAFYWSDPRARMPTLRRLAERGGVAERMEAVVSATTWPTHLSLVTGLRP